MTPDAGMTIKSSAGMLPLQITQRDPGSKIQVKTGTYKTAPISSVTLST